MTDLVIGIASGYSWSELEPFVVSLRRVYNGRCVLIIGEGPHDAAPIICDTATADLASKLVQYNIETFDLGRFTEHPIIARFPAIASVIRAFVDLRFVLACDTKDIVFQSDPTEWLSDHLGEATLCAVEEGYSYENSYGNRRNALEAFGQTVLDRLWNQPVINAGVLAGTPDAVADLCLAIYELCKQDLRLAYMTAGYQEMLADQTAANMLLRERPETLIVGVADGFVIEGNHFDKTRIVSGLVYPIDSQTPSALLHQYFCHREWLDLIPQYRER